MANEQLKEKIKRQRVFHYQIAEALEIPESAFSKSLRKELKEQQKIKIIQIVNELSERRECKCLRH